MLAALQLPVRRLLGEINGEQVRYRFGLTSLPPGEPSGADVSLGTVEIILPIAELPEWADQPIHVAVWFAAESREVGHLRVTELTSGREATTPVAPDTSLPGEFLVARQLTVASLADDRGVAVAIDGEIYREAWFQPLQAESEIFILPKLAGG